MRNKAEEIIVNRNQCVYCDQFKWCRYKLWFGKPADCPQKTEEEESEAAK